MELGPELYDADMSVLKAVAISQIILGIPLFIYDALEVFMSGFYDMGFFWYAAPLEMITASLSIFVGSFGLHLIRNKIRTKRHFDILSLTSFISCIIASLLLAIAAFTAMVSAVALVHSYRLGAMLQYRTLVRTSMSSDTVIQVFLVVLLILHLKVVRTAMFNANVMTLQNPERIPHKVAYENVTFGTPQKVSVIDAAENLLID